MGIYDVTVEQLPEKLRKKVNVVADADTVSRIAAAEFADLLAKRAAQGKLLTIIAPVGPLNYRFFAEEVKKRGLSCRTLRSINMDEYLDENDKLIPKSHPLSFKRFMEETFWSHLDDDQRPLPENIIFPDPDAPEKVTEIIDEVGGADICWAGFGITGHIAFNDPPAMLGEPTGVEVYRNCKTRKLTISAMATAQMMMGGTNGNDEVLPKRAVTVGMYELLKSKYFHCTFMRNWHAGLWRRAFLDPVTDEFPGSYLQEHPNLKITMTKLAAGVPFVNTAQATGEEA